MKNELFPRQKEPSAGWTIDFEFIDNLNEALREKDSFTGANENIEAVLLWVEEYLSTQGYKRGKDEEWIINR